MQVLVLDGSERFCNKCGELVPPHNDIRWLEAIRSGNAMFLFFKARHCLPVIRDGVVACPGSPSRAQYLEGQPRDDRGYPYIADVEVSYRAAWVRLQSGVN
jgi:hypothetical protein